MKNLYPKVPLALPLIFFSSKTMKDSRSICLITTKMNCQREYTSLVYAIDVLIFIQIAGTIYGTWLKKIIDQALKHRNTKLNEEEKGEFVVLEDKFYKDLQQTNFLSSRIN